MTKNNIQPTYGQILAFWVGSEGMMRRRWCLACPQCCCRRRQQKAPVASQALGISEDAGNKGVYELRADTPAQNW